MKPQKEAQSIGVSYLNAESWVSTFPAFTDKSPSPINYELLESLFGSKEITTEALLQLLHPEVQKVLHSPDQYVLTKEDIAEIKSAIESWREADLHFNTSESEYLSYLEKTTGIKHESPDITSAFKKNTQKAIAHTALAYQHLTEKESHLLPLSDMPSIIAHAMELYSLDLHPWWDFAISDDVSSKSSHDVSQKQSAPLFRDKDCPTIVDFFTKVIPKLLEIRKKDPNAAIKIFPQSKNVETFNWRISKDKNGNKVWTFEWYPGAYTPRAEEDNHKKVVKNRKITKEERIVRAIIKFDEFGNTIIGLKSQKDSNGLDIPYTFPVDKLDVNNLFESALIENNHDTMISSNNPFIFLKYLATDPRVRELITRFETVHTQFGDADLVVSGMIGPETVFFMDLDIETPHDHKSDRAYIEKQLKRNLQNKHTSYSSMLDQVALAPVVHEFDLEYIENMEHTFRGYVYELLKTAESGYIDIALLNNVVKLLKLLSNNNSISSATDLLTYNNRFINEDELRIIQRMLQCHEAYLDQANSRISVLSKQEQIFTLRSRSNLFQSTIPMITPTEMQVLTADMEARINQNVSFVSLLRYSKTVADL